MARRDGFVPEDGLLEDCRFNVFSCENGKSAVLVCEDSGVDLNGCGGTVVQDVGFNFQEGQKKISGWKEAFREKFLRGNRSLILGVIELDTSPATILVYFFSSSEKSIPRFGSLSVAKKNHGQELLKRTWQ